MNETIQGLFDRKSVRAFSSNPIAEEDKKLILASALQAPTAGNMALYSIIDVQDQQRKDTLSERCDHQPFIAKAPLVLLFLADYQKWYDLGMAYGMKEEIGKLSEADFLLAMQDCLIAAQNAVTAAQSLGIGSCYIGDIVEHYEENRELFHLPKYVMPCVLLVFGYPEPSQVTRHKPTRFAMEDMVFENQYPDKKTADQEAMFQRQRDIEKSELGHNQAGDTPREYVTHTLHRKFPTDFHREMVRSVKAMLKAWTE